MSTEDNGLFLSRNRLVVVVEVQGDWPQQTMRQNVRRYEMAKLTLLKEEERNGGGLSQGALRRDVQSISLEEWLAPVDLYSCICVCGMRACEFFMAEPEALRLEQLLWTSRLFIVQYTRLEGSSGEVHASACCGRRTYE